MNKFKFETAVLGNQLSEVICIVSKGRDIRNIYLFRFLRKSLFLVKLPWWNKATQTMAHIKTVQYSINTTVN